jgi:Reverse transcriptase (RNA-dependent DNA polymerase)
VTYRLSEAALQLALHHLCRYGDTDIFPHLPELAFFADREREVVAELTALDLDTYNPGGAIESLAPKGRLGFRIAHQLAALDTLLMLACTIELGKFIEARRTSEGFRSFSYRFNPGSNGKVFDSGHSYKDWLAAQLAFIRDRPQIVKVVSTDISDFYARINFHRLDNLLDEAASRHGAARFLKKQIKIIRAKQSFGLPVGGAASRLLAELALTDTDRALLDEGITATRYVDDFRIFLTATEDPYDVLGFLAEQLGINEGLSLNVSKTMVEQRPAFEAKLARMTTDVETEAQGIALESLTSEIYFDDDPDEEDIAALASINLIGFLEEEIDKAYWDVGQIKVLFRALRITTPGEAAQMIGHRFEDLVIFAKDLTLLMQALEKQDRSCFDVILDQVIDVILKPPASSVQFIRTWLLELFVRGVIAIPSSKLKRLELLPTPSDRRQLLLIRGRLADINHFRRHKTALDQLSSFEQPCLVWGASCLPTDEYDTWLANIRPSFSRPLGDLFLKWAKDSKSTLIARLSSDRDDHPD